MSDLPPVLVFPHLAKTGGTTLLYHFRKHLGDEAICSVGPHNRMQQVLNGQTLFEDMTADDFAPIRLMQGHGVDDAAVAMLAKHRDIILVTVLRASVPLARSRFNHRTKELGKIATTAKNDGTLSLEAFLKRHGKNPQARALKSAFSGLITTDRNNMDAKTRSLLKKFDHVLTTEQLDAQCVPIFDLLGLPPKMERRRVAEDKVDLALSDEEIYDNHPVDNAIHAAANQVSPDPSGHHNPFGFDRAGRDAAFARLSVDLDTYRARSYQKLAAHISERLMAEAALASMDAGIAKLGAPDMFARILSRTWAKQKAQLSTTQLERSEVNQQRWAKNRAAPRRRGLFQRS